MSLSPFFRKLLKLPSRIAERSSAALFFIISFLIPRSSRIWAFGSWYGLQFGDNPKHFFLYCSEMKSQTVQAVWLSRNGAVVRHVRDLGLLAHHWLSPLGIWYSLRAGVYVINCRVMDVSSIAARGATVVNLWHGIPLKKIEHDIEQADHPCVRIRRGPLPVRLAYALRHPELAEHYDFVLATSATTAARFQSAFGVRPDQTIPTGYPRNDPLFAATDAIDCLPPGERDLIVDFQTHAREGRRVLLYMPTFRDSNNVASRSIPINWTALESILEARGGVLYCKLHPYDQARLPSLDGLGCIRMIPPGFDVYPALRYTDGLITDYSSVFFDYLLLDKPILFYPYDLDEYQQLSRALYDPYDDVTPGPKARTAEELQMLVADLLDRYPEMVSCWRNDRVRVRTQAHEFADGRSSERLVAALLEKLAS